MAQVPERDVGPGEDQAALRPVQDTDILATESVCLAEANFLSSRISSPTINFFSSFSEIRYLRLAEDESNVKRQDYFTVLIYVASNPTGRPITWMYLQQKWPYLVRRSVRRLFKRICPWRAVESHDKFLF